jgi:GH15 family glucan-1,4-alpha-glucosidase
MVGDTRTAALIDRTGSVDWLCLPRFDSPACLASLLGTEDHGRFLIGPVDERYDVARRYRGDTLILETDVHASQGSVRLIDLMPIGSEHPVLVRIVQGLSGTVPMEMELIVRFDYGSIVPWVRRIDGAVVAIGGPDAVALRTPVDVHGRDLSSIARFDVEEGARIPFTLQWFPSFDDPPEPVDADRLERDTERWWTGWADRCTYDGEWRDDVVRSLITLKALTSPTTGAMVAAPTTSLPELIGGSRNWDYRFCWLRDSTSTLEALMAGGYAEEASTWRQWLMRAVAGDPAHTQIVYGMAGERRLPELELPWLPGYQGSSPVRIGNRAYEQFQLDVYGELLDVMWQARQHGLEDDPHSWAIERRQADFLEEHWSRPSISLWEGRGEERHFTHARVMAWVGLDRAVASADEHGLEARTDRWRRTREEIRRAILEDHLDEEGRAFVQYPGAGRLDASALLMPIVGFLPATDGRIVGTVEAIQERLMEDGFVRRFEPDLDEDRLPDPEGAFIACTLWLADVLALMGRLDDARETFERVLGVANDVRLLSEEYDVGSKRLLGNFPQALSHQWVVLVARNLAGRPERGRHAT